MAQINFDASQVAPMAPMEPVPSGWYTCMMTASEMKPTSKGDGGAYLETEFTILDPEEFKGRKLFDRMNLANANPTAVEIAYRTLSAICHAVGVIQVADSSQLHNRPLMVKANLRPAGMGGDGKQHEASNEVKGYKAVDGAGPSGAAAPVAPPTTPAAAPAPVAAPAWTPPAPAWAAAPTTPAPAPVAAAPAPVAPTTPAFAPGATPPWLKKG